MNENRTAPLRISGGRRWPLLLAALPMLLLLVLPVLSLVFSSSPQELKAGITHRDFASSLWLSARTSVLSLGLVIVLGTPLAWWISSSGRKWARAVELLATIPIVLPPAVVGIALLSAFGRRGALGSFLDLFSLSLPFSLGAVVLAQVTVSAPFYIQAAAAAFRRIDGDLLLVARTLGQNSRGAFFRVAAPLALPGMIGGAALAWARALGEFGATLLFAGNQPGVTQTMPLAVYTTLESDVRVAVALALVLAALSIFLLGVLHLAPLILRKDGVR